MGALVGAVLGAVADGQGIHTGGLDELDGIQGIGIRGGLGKHVVLHPRQNPQLSFYSNAPLMGQLHHFPGQGNVLFKRQAGAVDHHGGVAPVHGGDAGIDGLTVV